RPRHPARAHRHRRKLERARAYPQLGLAKLRGHGSRQPRTPPARAKHRRRGRMEAPACELELRPHMASQLGAELGRSGLPRAEDGGCGLKLIDPEFEAMQHRLHRACLTSACLPGDGPKAFFSTGPRYKLDWYDAED